MKKFISFVFVLATFVSSEIFAAQSLRQFRLVDADNKRIGVLHVGADTTVSGEVLEDTVFATRRLKDRSVLVLGLGPCSNTLYGWGLDDQPCIKSLGVMLYESSDCTGQGYVYSAIGQGFGFNLGFRMAQYLRFNHSEGRYYEVFYAVSPAETRTYNSYEESAPSDLCLGWGGTVLPGSLCCLEANQEQGSYGEAVSEPFSFRPPVKIK